MLLSVAVVATMGLASCGGEEEAAGESKLCACMKEKPGEESAACKELSAEWAKKATDAKTPEDKQKVMDAAAAATKDCKE